MKTPRIELNTLWQRIILPAALLALILLSGTVRADTPPGRWVFVPELSDDFANPVLDTTRWRPYNPYNAGPVMIKAENIEMHDGIAWLWTRRLTDGQFTTSWLNGKRELQYGYVELRAQLAPSRVNQNLWFYRWTPKGTREIDVFEIAPGSPGHERTVHTNLHAYDGNPELENDTNRRSLPMVWSDPDYDPTRFNTYGIEWTAERLRWYVNGRIIRESVNRDFHEPMMLIMASGIHPDWFGVPTADTLPSVMRIDYIRTWQKAPSISNTH